MAFISSVCASRRTLCPSHLMMPFVFVSSVRVTRLVIHVRFLCAHRCCACRWPHHYCACYSPYRAPSRLLFLCLTPSRPCPLPLNATCATATCVARAVSSHRCIPVVVSASKNTNSTNGMRMKWYWKGNKRQG
jgi:hypothetical protein